MNNLSNAVNFNFAVQKGKINQAREYFQEIIFLIPEFTVQVVFRQPNAIMATPCCPGTLVHSLKSDINDDSAHANFYALGY